MCARSLEKEVEGENGMAIENLEQKNNARYNKPDHDIEECPLGKERNPSSRRDLSVC